MTLTRSILWTNPSGAVTVAKPGESARLPDESDDDFLSRMATRLVPEGLTPRIVADADVAADADLIAAEVAAVAARNLAERAAASATVEGSHAPGKLQRAVAAVLCDEINLVRQWTVALKAAVAGAGTLAALKTAVAALDTLSDRTLSQAKTAIQGKLSSGAAD